MLASGLSNIPSILHDLQIRGETDDGTVADDTRWAHESFAARADQPLAFSSPAWPVANFPASEEALAATRALLLQSRTACARTGVHPSALLSLYRDVDTSSPFFGNGQPVWLGVRWFRTSPYSPAQLETHPHCHQYGSMWRAAFEDLLHAATDREVSARDAWTGVRPDSALYDAWAQTPRDWMIGLMCRGTLPPQLPSLYRLGCTRQMDGVFSRLMTGRPVGPSGEAARRDLEELAREVGTIDEDEQPQVQKQSRTPAQQTKAQPQIQRVRRENVSQQEQDKETQTELDAYEHFLGKASSASVPDEVVTPPVQQQQQPRESAILSTLSTTERTTLPDGTVTTKVVLRKRFVDGREESTETVSTSHAQPVTQTDNEKTLTTEGEQGKSRGWFWN